MSSALDRYAEVAGPDVIEHLQQLATPLRGLKIVHVNSTRLGGGVAEILNKLVPFMQDVGLEARWEVVSGDEAFFECTKRFHNGLQGNTVELGERLLDAYEQTNRANAEQLRPHLEEADVVFIHDPQPAALLQHFPTPRAKWVWRCHIDVSHPYRPVWRYLRRLVTSYDASIFSLADFAQPLPHPQYLVSPSIDPLSEKNVTLDPGELEAVRERFDLDPQKHLVVQISRFDRFKDPVGVIRAYRLARRYIPSLQLVLAGGEANDDPEGAAVLQEVQEAAASDQDIRVLLLPPDAHRTINGLQRAADLVLQKSIREGFGLTVTEAMWKGRPVIGGNTGGIRLQIVNHHTGFLVDTPEGAALRIRYLLSHRDKLVAMGKKAQRFVRENFLLTRHLMEYLTLIHGLIRGQNGRIELS
jgi:trehalose synthase